MSSRPVCRSFLRMILPRRGLDNLQEKGSLPSGFKKPGNNIVAWLAFLQHPIP